MLGDQCYKKTLLQLSLEYSYSIEHTQWKKVQAWVDILQISVSCQPKPWIAAFVHRNATKVYMLHDKNAQNSVPDFLSYAVMFKKDREETKESALNCMMMSVFQISSQSLIHGNFFSHLHRLYQVFLSNHFFQDFIAKKLRTFTILFLYWGSVLKFVGVPYTWMRAIYFAFILSFLCRSTTRD